MLCFRCEVRSFVTLLLFFRVNPFQLWAPLLWGHRTDRCILRMYRRAGTKQSEFCHSPPTYVSRPFSPREGKDDKRHSSQRSSPFSSLPGPTGRRRANVRQLSTFLFFPPSPTIAPSIHYSTVGVQKEWAKLNYPLYT